MLKLSETRPIFYRSCVVRPPRFGLFSCTVFSFPSYLVISNERAVTTAKCLCLVREVWLTGQGDQASDCRSSVNDGLVSKPPFLHSTHVDLKIYARHGHSERDKIILRYFFSVRCIAMSALYSRRREQRWTKECTTACNAHPSLERNGVSSSLWRDLYVPLGVPRHDVLTMLTPSTRSTTHHPPMSPV